jgi:hypothetical protein
MVSHIKHQTKKHPSTYYSGGYFSEGGTFARRVKSTKKRRAAKGWD